MPETLEFTVDKFTFTVPADRLYHADGLWVREDGGRLVVGLTDYFQQHSGDVAFVELAAPGTVVTAGERLGNVETIKVDAELSSPVSGTVVEVNERLELEAEVINQDPYGEGWLAAVEPAAWEREKAALLSPQAYFELSQAQALEETGKS
jgi:glycine cleavage system H protein